MIPMFARQPQEKREGGFREDVLRYWQQTNSHGAMRFIEFVLIFAAVYFWGRVAADYMEAQTVTGNLVDMMTYALWIASLIITGYVAVRIIWSDSVSDDATTRAIVVAVSVGAWIAFNYFASPVIVYALYTIQNNLMYVVPFIVVCGAFAFVPSFEIGRHGLRREVTEQTAFNSENYWLAEQKEMFEREKRDLNSELQVALNSIDQLNARVAYLTAENHKMRANPIKEFAPYNHGNAKSMPIGARSFDADEQQRLSMWIGGWSKRGTSRDNWTTHEAEKLYGWRVSYPEWDKFTDALKGLRYLDEMNKPLLKPDEIIAKLHLPPYPTDETQNTTATSVSHDTTRPDTKPEGG